MSYEFGTVLAYNKEDKNVTDMRYFRQALALMREERLYSAMYIAGTALAVAFVMLIAEVYYVKVADIAPEVHRSTTYYLDDMTLWDKEDDQTTELKNIHYETYRDLFQKMQTPEYMAAEMEMWSNTLFGITLADSVHKYSTSSRARPSRRPTSTTVETTWSSQRICATISSDTGRKAWDGR